MPKSRDRDELNASARHLQEIDAFEKGGAKRLRPRSNCAPFLERDKSIRAWIR